VSPVKYELGFYIPEDDILHLKIKCKPQGRPQTFNGLLLDAGYNIKTCFREIG
jgi:hypothetical protein